VFRHLRLIWLFARLGIQNNAAYRFDFFMRLVVSFVQMAGELVGLWIIFSNTRSLAGWNAYQVLVLLGVFRFMTGVIGLVIAPNMRLIMEDVRNGTLDFVLTKPVNSQFYASFRQIVIWRLIDLALGVGLATFGGLHLAAQMSVGRVLLFLLMLGLGATVIYSFWLILATAAFWFTRIDNMEMVFWNVFEAGRYPVDIYRPWVRWALTYLVPLAFLITFPAGALAGKTGAGALLAAMLVAPVTLLGASLFWRYGLRHYSGASA